MSYTDSAHYHCKRTHVRLKKIIKHMGIQSNITHGICYSEVQYKPLHTISNNVKVYEESVPRTMKISHCAVKFEAGEENRIIYESLY